jgi:hypothetical protein
MPQPILAPTAMQAATMGGPGLEPGTLMVRGIVRRVVRSWDGRCRRLSAYLP